MWSLMHHYRGKWNKSPRNNWILHPLTPGFLKGRLGNTTALVTINPSMGNFTSLSLLGLGNTIKWVGSNLSSASCAPGPTPSAALTLNLDEFKSKNIFFWKFFYVSPGKWCWAANQGIENVTKGVAGPREQFYANLKQWMFNWFHNLSWIIGSLVEDVFSTCLGPENMKASLGSVAIVYSCKSFVRLCRVNTA